MTQRKRQGDGRSPFKDWAYRHPFYDTVFSWILKQIVGLSEPTILLVIGPSGVGKTTLIRELQIELSNRLTPILEREPSRIAWAYGEVVYLPGRGIDWEGLLSSLLTSGGEPLVGLKVKNKGFVQRSKVANLLDALEIMLAHKNPEVLFIDEAALLVESEKNLSVNRVLGFLKSLSNRSGTHLALFGDYRLARMLELNGQLNRRCRVIHFPRYPIACESTFAEVVRKFEDQLSDNGIRSNIRPASSLLHQQTVGCVGLLKTLLERIVLDVQSGQTIDEKLIRTHSFPVGAVARWNAEIDSGESIIKMYFEGGESRT